MSETTDGWRLFNPPDLITEEKSKKKTKEEKGGLFRKNQKNEKRRKNSKNFEIDSFRRSTGAFEFEVEVLKLSFEIEKWRMNWEEWQAKVCEEDENGEQESNDIPWPQSGSETENETSEEEKDSSASSGSEVETEDKSKKEKITNKAPDRNNINNKFEVDDFNVAVMNAGGIKSKQMSISNIVNKFDIRALIVSETHLSGKEKPVVNDNMTAFFDNRSEGLNKGGISIFLENSIAKKTVVVGKSSSENEWIAVKTNYFKVPLVIIGVYGTQSNKVKNILQQTWDELWDFAEKMREDNMVILGGDLNCALGKSFNLRTNDHKMNTNGRIIKPRLEKGWCLLNSHIRGNVRSHKDRTSGTSRCLDYIVTSHIDNVTRVHMDDDLEMTPYKVVNTNDINTAKPNHNNNNRSYTDHKTVMATFKLKVKESKVKYKPPPVIVKDTAGDVKFFSLSEAVADYAIDKLNEGMRPDRLLKAVMRKLKECEREAYLRITKTKIKRKMWSDHEIFLKVTKDLEKQEENLKKLKPNDKIFKIRSNHLLKERGEEAFAMFDENGTLIEDIDGVTEVLTRYNEKLLSRVAHPEEFKEIFKLKKETVELLSKTKVEHYNTITPDEYLKAIRRITIKGKGMFKQFLKTSFRMQAVFYFIFKAMYEQETLPESTFETLLIALYKKGDARDPSNYRYLHIKLDIIRIFELLVYFKLEGHFDKVTSECQQGGMKRGDTIENLAMLSSIIVDREDNNRGLLMTAVDAIKCFDRVHLSDSHAVLQLSGGDKKALKMLYKMSETNKLRVAGGREITINNGDGQGSISAARKTTFMIDECTVRHSSLIPRDMWVVHREEPVNNEGFVDDELLLAEFRDASAVGSKLYSRTMDELSMSAHPKKSVQIVAGDPKWVEKMKEELKENPCQMQDFQLKVSESEKYLGMYFVSGQYSSSLDMNIDHKCKKMMTAASSIRVICNIPGVRRVGKLQAQKLLIMSQISPICLYGMQAWLRVTDSQYSKLESGFKKAIMTVLSVPSCTNYEALLRQINNIHVRQFSDAIKLKCWNFKLWIKAKGKMVRVLQFEIGAGIKSGLAGELEATCKMYGIPNICLFPANPKLIDFHVKRFSYNLQWQKHLELRSLPTVPHPGKARHRHMTLPYNQGRAYQAYELGLLVFKESREYMFPDKHRGDKKCPNIPCQNVDNLLHSFSCEYVQTKWTETGDFMTDMSKYLCDLNIERITNHGVPLIVMGDTTSAVMEEVLEYSHVQSVNKKTNQDIARIITKDEGVTEFKESNKKSKVFRLDYKCAQVVRKSQKADMIPIPSLELAKYFSPEATTSKMLVRGLVDLISGGRSQSAYRHTLSNDPTQSRKLVKSMRSLCFTVDSCIRVSRSFTSIRGLSSDHFNIMSSATNSYIKSTGSGNVNISHERYIKDLETSLIKLDLVHRFKTVKSGTEAKTLEIEQETLKDSLSELKITETGAKIQTSETVYDSETRTTEKAKQKKMMSKADRDAKIRKRKAEREIYSSDSEEEDIIYEWMFQNRKDLRGEPTERHAERVGDNVTDVDAVDGQLSLTNVNNLDTNLDMI